MEKKDKIMKEEMIGVQSNKEESRVEEMSSEVINTEKFNMDTNNMEKSDHQENEVNTKEKMKKEKRKKKEKKELDPVEKKRKKKIRRRIILGICAVVIVGFMVINSITQKNMGIPVQTVEASLEDITQEIATSGNVKSDNVLHYFAPTSLKIGAVNVSAGDVVKKGDVLLSFDKKALASAKLAAQSKLQMSVSDYESTMLKENKYIAELGEANVNLPVLEQQITDSENYVKELEQKVADKRSALAYEGTLLQISLIEWSDKPYTEEYENLQKLIQRNTYEQSNNSEIRAWEKEISEYQDKIAAYKEYKAEMKSQKTASENSVLNDSDKTKLEASVQYDNDTYGDILAAIEEVENGVVAQFDGVVTSIDAIPGSTVSEGQKLFVLESIEQVSVDINISKYDLEKIALDQQAEVVIVGNTYTGKVKKIDGMATLSANNTPMIGASIEIENPDNGIYLGVEARVKVNTAQVSGVVAIPIEMINTGKDGDFVYVVEDGMVAKKNVVVGISSDTLSEVKEGLSVGDTVIVPSSVELEEGTKVTAVPLE